MTVPLADTLGASRRPAVMQVLRAGEQLSLSTPVAKKPTDVAGAAGQRLEVSTCQIVQQLLLNIALCQIHK
jgi:hypothetical protein